MSQNETSISLKSLVPKAFRKGFFLNFRGRYRIFKGARNTGKSHTMIGIESIIKLASDERRNIMIVRMNANSNRQSTYENICGRILDMGMGDRFKMVTSPVPEITFKTTGQKIIFRGLNDPTTLNSITFSHGFLTDVYIEEAFEIESYDDFRKLDFSLRGLLPEGLFLQITLCFNAWSKEHWIYERFFKGNLEDDFDILDDPSTEYMDWCDPNWQGDFGKGLYLNTSTYKCNPFRDKESIDPAALAMRERSHDIYAVEFLGMWGNAGSATYPEFTESCIMELKQIYAKYAFSAFAIGIDTGYSNGEGGKRVVHKNEKPEERVKAAHAVELIGITDDYESIVVLDEYFHSEIERNGQYNTDESGQIGVAELIKRTADVIQAWERKYRPANIGLFRRGQPIEIYIDSADAITGQLIKKEFEIRGIYNIEVYRSTKISIQNRSDFEKVMMAWGNFIVCSQCKNAIREIKASHRDKNGRARADGDDHAITAFEYGFTPKLGLVHMWKQFKER